MPDNEELSPNEVAAHIEKANEISPDVARIIFGAFIAIEVAALAVAFGFKEQDLFWLPVAVIVVGVVGYALAVEVQVSRAMRLSLCLLFLVSLTAFLWAKFSSANSTAPAASPHTVSEANHAVGIATQGIRTPQCPDRLAFTVTAIAANSPPGPAIVTMTRSPVLGGDTRNTWINDNVFYVPCDGLYLFSWTFVKDTGTGTTNDIALRLMRKSGDDTKEVANAWAGENTGGRVGGTRTVTITLKAGDALSLWSDSSGQKGIRDPSLTIVKLE